MDTLLIMAHADDETLSCGGLALNRKSKRLEVGLITIFGRKYNYGAGPQYEKEQYSAWVGSCDTLGINTRYYENLPEGNTNHHSELKILSLIEKTLTLHQPKEVVIHDCQDRNQDHTWLSNVCKIALRTWAYPSVSRILMCQSPDGLPKITNHYEPQDAASVHRKCKAFGWYEQELRNDPHPRSTNNLISLSAVTGSMCNAEYAEAYRVYYQKEM